MSQKTASAVLRTAALPVAKATAKPGTTIVAAGISTSKEEEKLSVPSLTGGAVQGEAVLKEFKIASDITQTLSGLSNTERRKIFSLVASQFGLRVSSANAIASAPAPSREKARRPIGRRNQKEVQPQPGQSYRSDPHWVDRNNLRSQIVSCLRQGMEVYSVDGTEYPATPEALRMVEQELSAAKAAFRLAHQQGKL